MTSVGPSPQLMARTADTECAQIRAISLCAEKGRVGVRSFDRAFPFRGNKLTADGGPRRSHPNVTIQLRDTNRS